MKALVEVPMRGLARVSFPESREYAQDGELMSEADINDMIVQLRGARAKLACIELCAVDDGV